MVFLNAGRKKIGITFYKQSNRLSIDRGDLSFEI